MRWVLNSLKDILEESLIDPSNQHPSPRRPICQACLGICGIYLTAIAAFPPVADFANFLVSVLEMGAVFEPYLKKTSPSSTRP